MIADLPEPGTLLGVDAGGTVVKAVLFDLDGTALAEGHARCPLHHPGPGFVERDPEQVWQACVAAVATCLGRAEELGHRARVAAIGVTGHGDGGYLVDAHGRPTRAAITASDGRAVAQATRLSTAEVLHRSGTYPFPGSPPPLMAWLAQHEPETLTATAAWLSCKDWLRLRLTGHLGTDYSDASGAFLDIRSCAYSDELLASYGLTRWRGLLPPLSRSTDVVGRVSAAAAAQTRLRIGTPVVCGSHDCDAAAVGMGAVTPGTLSMIAGTFSINQVASDTARVDPRWQTRVFLSPGRYLAMGTSPASASNLDWFVRTRGPSGPAAFETVNREVAEVPAGPHDPAGPVFLPFLYGAPHGRDIGAGFLGVRGEHTRAHLLRAVLEGVVCNHRMHVEALRETYPLAGPARLAGGGARSPVWVQLFADALGQAIEVPSVTEAGALGAAVLAGLGAGVWPDLTAAVAATTSVQRVVEPAPAGVRRFDAVYARYRRALDAVVAAALVAASPVDAAGPATGSPAGPSS
jgi:L-xylulokinase